MKEVNRRNQFAALGMAILAQLSASLMIQSVSPLAPLFQADLGLSKAGVGLLTSAISAGSWWTFLITGVLTDRLGVRAAVFLSLVVSGSVMLSMSLTQSLLQAVVVMFLASSARGGAFSGSTKAVMEWFSSRARATAMGVKQMGSPMAGVLAGLVLPAIGLAIGWRAAFSVVALFILLSGIVAALVYRGAPTSTPISSHNTNTRAILGEMVRNPTLLSICFVGFCFHLVQLGSVSFLPLYFKEIVLVSAIPDDSARIVAAGGYLAVCQVGGALGRLGWGVISDRWFYRRRIASMVIVGVLTAAMSFVMGNLGTGTPVWLLTPIVFAYGAMSVGWNGVYYALVTEAVGRKYVGTGVGLSMTLTEIGSIAAAPLFGFVVDTSSFQTAWYLLACSSVVGSLVAMIKSRKDDKAMVGQAGR